MSISKKDLDPAFQGVGQKAGLEIWRIENFNPVPIPESSHGKFFTGDSYIVLKTTALKSGAFRHDIHYWLGKDTSQDEAGTAAIKTVELDAMLGGRAVQYREVQGHESEKFLSYFKPCIIPQEGGVATGFKHAEAEEHQTRLFVCQGKHVVHVKEATFARSSLNHDDVFILDTKSKIYQFNGSNSCIQERAKALEVVQYIKDTYHDGKCEVAAVEDGRLMADAEAGEFWAFFGGFAPLPKKASAAERDNIDGGVPNKLYCIEKGQAEPVEADSLTKELLDTNKCYILDSGIEVFAWIGKNTSLEERKASSRAVDELLQSLDRTKSHVIRVIEGYETVMFRSKFDSWPETKNTAAPEEGRGRVAAMLRRQGVDVKGLVKDEAPIEEDDDPHIDCAGDLQVWRVNGREKTLLSANDQGKVFSGDCYIFQYSYPGVDREDYLVGTWFGNQSVEEDRAGALSQANKMIEALKLLPAQARIHEGSEPVMLFAIFQSFIVFKGGLSDGYKKYIAENELPDDTYSEDGRALFRIQGSGPENMQAIQVEPVASSLNSAYCYILHDGATVFDWSGSLTSPDNQELAERNLDIIKPNMQSRHLKEGVETEQFWELLGGKTEHPSQKITREKEGDPHLFACTISKSLVQVTEIHNFNQDDLLTEDVFILDCHSDIFVWVGKEVDAKSKSKSLQFGEKYLERDFLLEKLSTKTPIYVITEGNEPQFFTRFFTWDPKKCAMHGNSFERKLSLIKGTPMLDKPRRRVAPGRASNPEKAQRSRSVCFTSERPRVRGRSPAFNALASTFENPNARNLSTPPPMVGKTFPKSISPTPMMKTTASRSAAIAALTSGFEQQMPARSFLMPRSLKANEFLKPKSESVQEGAKEEEGGDNDSGQPIYPYDRLKTSSTDPVADIDITKRESYLSKEEFMEKFGMSKRAFYALPKWKQGKLKLAVELF
ncbi:villin-4-like isoform X1 [Andrographis paniculata]|uniref:villin-4-like isoform X1 n=1 Tax=Andrographis paniculata TaxID=175694 RepID=UPI0021E7225F|nr:villin-4-like isoform X1 [Andrographis paniculata]